LSETRTEAAASILEVIPLVMRVLAAELRRTGHTLAPSHFRLLAVLYGRRATQTELAHLIAVSPPTISRTVRTLEERGWVRRVHSKQDGRVVLTELTPAGEAVLDDMKCKALRKIDAYVAPLSAEERRQLVEGMNVLQHVFLRALDDLEDPSAG
jgi:DNA-binding MarR family transcriptional regulator